MNNELRTTNYQLNTSDERQATCDEFALFWSFYVSFCTFYASLRLTRTVFTRLQIKVRPKGLHSFAFYILIFDFSFLPLMSLCANTYVSTRHLYNCRATITDVMSALQIRLFMQNKANFRESQMNVSTIKTRGYKNKSCLRPPKKQSQTNPNKAKFKKAKMNVTSYITKGYENKPPIRAPKKQSQISKRQKPTQTSLPKGIMKKTALSASGKTNPNKPNMPEFSPVANKVNFQAQRIDGSVQIGKISENVCFNHKGLCFIGRYRP